MSNKLRKILSVLLILIILASGYVIVDEYINGNKQTNEVKNLKSLIAKNINVDRKILADLAVNNPEAFKAIVTAVKEK